MKKLLLIFLCLCFSASASFAQDKSSATAGGGQSAGPATDRSNTPVEDPSRNQRDLVLAEARRQDDLRAVTDTLNKERGEHQKEMAAKQEQHQKELRIADRSEQTAIRLVDREDVAKTTTSANNAIAALAKQTTDLSTTLAQRVQDTAVVTEGRQTTFSANVNARLQSLENALSEGRGKQTATEPQAAALMEEVRALTRTIATGTGKSEGVNTTFYAILGVGGLLLAFLTFIYRQSKANGAYARKNGGP